MHVHFLQFNNFGEIIFSNDYLTSTADFERD